MSRKTVLGQGSTRARRWVIPWGNNSERGKGKGKQKHGEKDEEDTRLTRTLKVLPDAADDVEESDCFRVMRWGEACDMRRLDRFLLFTRILRSPW